MTDQPKHTLVITVNTETLNAAMVDDPKVDITDIEFLEASIRCDADKEDFTRDCMTWWECRCELTEDQAEKLEDEGQGPCPESPTGLHNERIGDLSPARPSRQCWALEWDGTADEIQALIIKHKLGPGEYPLYMTPDHDRCNFELVMISMVADS